MMERLEGENDQNGADIPDNNRDEEEENVANGHNDESDALPGAFGIE